MCRNYDGKDSRKSQPLVMAYFSQRKGQAYAPGAADPLE